MLSPSPHPALLAPEIAAALPPQTLHGPRVQPQGLDTSTLLNLEKGGGTKAITSVDVEPAAEEHEVRQGWSHRGPRRDKRDGGALVRDSDHERTMMTEQIVGGSPDIHTTGGYGISTSTPRIQLYPDPAPMDAEPTARLLRLNDGQAIANIVHAQGGVEEDGDHANFDEGAERHGTEGGRLKNPSSTIEWTLWPYNSANGRSTQETRRHSRALPPCRFHSSAHTKVPTRRHEEDRGIGGRVGTFSHWYLIKIGLTRHDRALASRPIFTRHCTWCPRLQVSGNPPAAGSWPSTMDSRADSFMRHLSVRSGCRRDGGSWGTVLPATETIIDNLSAPLTRRPTLLSSPGIKASTLPTLFSSQHGFSDGRRSQKRGQALCRRGITLCGMPAIVHPCCLGNAYWGGWAALTSSSSPALNCLPRAPLCWFNLCSLRVPLVTPSLSFRRPHWRSDSPLSVEHTTTTVTLSGSKYGEVSKEPASLCGLQPWGPIPAWFECPYSELPRIGIHFRVCGRRRNREVPCRSRLPYVQPALPTPRLELSFPSTKQLRGHLAKQNEGGQLLTGHENQLAEPGFGSIHDQRPHGRLSPALQRILMPAGCPPSCSTADADELCHTRSPRPPSRASSLQLTSDSHDTPQLHSTPSPAAAPARPSPSPQLQDTDNRHGVMDPTSAASRTGSAELPNMAQQYLLATPCAIFLHSTGCEDLAAQTFCPLPQEPLPTGMASLLDTLLMKYLSGTTASSISLFVMDATVLSRLACDKSPEGVERSPHVQVHKSHAQ
ncbi:hypothetical protein IMY05_C4535000300 [Salix suchowensis]|nr:hypothetical protein IMY05_C4535000300 [Salix suchowensis]